MKFKSLLIMAFAAFSSAAMAEINYTFTDGQMPTGMTLSDGGTGKIVNGNLIVQMPAGNDGNHRSDIKFANAFTLNPTTDKVLAIKFLGYAPKGNIKMEFHDGDKWHNTLWASSNNNKHKEKEDGAKNVICYYPLTDDTDYASWTEGKTIQNLNIIIADNKNYSSYSVDWIKTFASVEDLNSYINTKDDGDNDYAVYNNTTNTGYDNLLTAVNEASAGTSDAEIEVRQFCNLTGRADIKNHVITIKGSDPDIVITRSSSNMFFLATGSSAGTLKLQDLVLDGLNASNPRAVEINASSAADGHSLTNVVIKNISSSQSGAGLLLKKKVTVENCTFQNVHTTDASKSTILVGASDALVLKGANEFTDCDNDIYIESTYRIKTITGLSNVNPIGLYFDTNERSDGSLLIMNRNSDDTNNDNNIDLSKFNILNEGFRLKQNQKDNGHLYEMLIAKAPTVSFTETCPFATFCVDYPSWVPVGVEAYKAVNVGDGKITFQPIEGNIPANTGVLLHGAAGTYTLQTAKEATEINGNLLIGTTEEISTPGNCYAMNKTRTSAESLVFQQYTGEKFPANKAYLEIPSASVKTISFVFDGEGTWSLDGDATAIQNAETQNSSLKTQNCYNLQGMKVNASYRGIVIKNGKKYINK